MRLVDCSPGGCKESDMAEWLALALYRRLSVLFALSCTQLRSLVDASPQLPAASAHSQVYNSFLGSPAPWWWILQSHSRNLGRFPVGRLGLSSLIPQRLGESDPVFGQWASFSQPFHRHLASVTPEETGSFLLLPAGLMTSSLLSGGLDPQRHFFFLSLFLIWLHLIRVFFFLFLFILFSSFCP